MNFLQKITDAYGKIAWKENENARKRTQLEYEIVRQLANDMFEQAQEEMANFPAFDISHFQKIFSTVIGQSVPLRANSYFGSTADPTYPKNFGFQSTKGKVRKLLHEQHGMSDNSKHEMEIDKEWNKGKWTRNRFLREPQNDVSYKLFGAMPKFDPRFPFDRAYKLMEDLQPPKTLKFPSIHFYI